MPNATLPADIGVAEVRSIFNQLEKEASNRERDLMDAARQIMLDEELLDALYVKYEDLDTDFRRTEFSAESTLDKLKLFRDRNEEIVSEVSVVETELPLLSSNIKRFPAARGVVGAQDIFSQLERLSQRQAFLQEGLRKLQEYAEEDGKTAFDAGKSHEKVHRQPVDPLLLKLSEGKVLQGNLEWELGDIEEKLRNLEAKLSQG